MILRSLVDNVGGPPITRDGARAAAVRELSKGIYHRNDDPWPVRVFNAVQHWLGRLLDDIAKHSPGGGAGATALVVGLAIVLLALRWRLGPMRRADRAPVLVGSDRSLTAADHRREAEQAAAQGRWSDAVLFRMRALARGLEECGDLPQRPGRTAAELAVEIADLHPSAASGAAAAARVFDEVAYGHRPGTQERYAMIVAADDACLAASSR